MWHRSNITFATWNKGKIYTVSLFLAQLFFWFSPFKKRVFCQPHCEHWQEWPKQILFAMILILMTQDYWTWVGGSNFCWKWLPWWHVKIRWWVLRIRRKWWLANIDVFPYTFSHWAYFSKHFCTQQVRALSLLCFYLSLLQSNNHWKLISRFKLVFFSTS